MANIYKVTKEQYDALVSGKGINCNNVVFTYDEAAVYDVVDYAGIAYSIKRDGDIIQLLGDDQVLSQLSIEEVSEAKHAINATRALGLHYANNNDVTTYYDNDGNLITKFAGSDGLAYTGMRIGKESVGLYTISGNSTFLSFKASYSYAEINANYGICLDSNYTSVVGKLSVCDDTTDYDGYRPTSNFGSETDPDVHFYGTGIAVYGNNTGATYRYSYPAKSGTFAMISDLADYLPLTGGTLTGNLTAQNTSILASGTSNIGSTDTAFNTEFVKTIYTNKIGSYDMNLNIEAESNITIASSRANPNGKVTIDGTDIPKNKTLATTDDLATINDLTNIFNGTRS